MLLAILILFLITEFPSGILNLLAAVLGESFMNNIYVNLGEVIDLLALINNGVNFILYCTMSRQFRKTFQKTFCCNCICFFKPINKASAAAKLLNAKTGNQSNRNSMPNEKTNLMNQKLNQNNNSNKKISSNEIDDDDQELVTMNETKQNSSTIDMDDDYLMNCSQDNLNNLNKLSKSSLKQETILEYKENLGDVCTDETNTIETLNTSLIVNNNNSKEQINQLDDDRNEIKDKIILDSNSTTIKNNNLTKFRIHRNSSIDLSNPLNNFENRKNKSLHRHDSRRHRYRRKTIANVNSDLKKSLSTCV